jgi:zinc transporter
VVRIGEDGISQELPIDEPVQFESNGIYWLHFNLADARALLWLSSAGLQMRAQTLLLSNIKTLFSKYMLTTVASTE